MAMSSVREMEEERRLLYVAVTRAMEQCYITYALNRYKYGRSEFCEPSSFLRDFDRQFLSFDGSSQISSKSEPRTTSFQTTSFQRPLFRSVSSIDQSSSASARYSSASTQNSSAFSQLSPTSAQPAQSTGVSANNQSLHVGSRIEHTRFGIGEVIAMSGDGIDAKATVRFENVGVKQLLLRFAKITII